MIEIPDYWDYAPVSDYCGVNNINRKPADEFPDREFDYITVSCVDGDEGKITDTEKEVGKDAPSRAKREIHTGDVIVSTVRPYLRAFAVVPEELDNQICSTAFAVLTPGDDILTDYLWYATRFDDFVNQLKEEQRGSSYPAVGIRDVKSSKIPVPPKEEQEVIVNQLNRLFKKVDETKTARNRVEEIESELVYSVFLNSIEEVDTQLVPLESVIKDSQYGISQAMNENGEGYPILRMGNYDETGEMDYSELKHVPLPDDEFSKYHLAEGDVLFNRTNSKELVGKCAIFDGELDDAVFASYLIRVHLDEAKLLPEFFVNYMNSPRGRIEIDKKAKQAVSQANINSQELREMEIPLPNIGQQKRILDEIRSIEEKAEEIAMASERTTEILSELPSSILKQAFTGELTETITSEPPESVAQDGGFEQSSIENFNSQ
ncbi:restriction endonuclease subunit S [Haloferax gibbonsii]|uniref:restriction endonuclease subunit S n=1 Tax=Haloferax gibbonsii TaxID=35746 RepID=UPI000B1CE986|nr:restriction endonuclease subunit S [Haloferax gibbonsii]